MQDGLESMALKLLQIRACEVVGTSDGDEQNEDTPQCLGLSILET